VVWESGLDLKSAIRSPSILYLQNPLHPQALAHLLHHLDFDLVDVETLIGCVDTGDWTCLLKESSIETMNAQLKTEVVQTLENLCLLSFYLRSCLRALAPSSGVAVSAPEDPQERADDGLIQDLVARLLQTVRTK